MNAANLYAQRAAFAIPSPFPPVPHPRDTPSRDGFPLLPRPGADGNARGDDVEEYPKRKKAPKSSASMTGMPVSPLSCSSGPDPPVTVSPTTANANPTIASRPLNRS